MRIIKDIYREYVQRRLFIEANYINIMHQIRVSENILP